MLRGSSVLIAVALLGCDTATGPKGLAVDVALSSHTLTVGEQVTITVTVVNPRNHPVRLTGSGGCVIGFEVVERPLGTFCRGIVANVHIAPGEVRTFTFHWDGGPISWSGIREMYPSGAYTIRARILINRHEAVFSDGVELMLLDF